MLKILITDDDRVAVKGIRLLLSQKEYNLEILEAYNGQSALDILRETPIDILFTDIDMPQVNGIELAERAQQLYPAVKIIFFSSYNDFAYAKRAIQLNAVSYLLKPIQPAEFYEVLEHAIQLCQKEKEQDDKTHRLDFMDELSAKREMELYLSDLFFQCEMEADVTLPTLPILADDANVSIQLVFLRSNVPLLVTERNQFDELVKRISNVPVEFYAISGSYGIVMLKFSGKQGILLNWDTWWLSFKQGLNHIKQDISLLAIRTKQISAMSDLIFEMRSICRLSFLNSYMQETTLIQTEYSNTDKATSFQIDHIMEDVMEIISQKEFHHLSEKIRTLMNAVFFNHAYSPFYMRYLLLSIVRELEKQIPNECLASMEKLKSMLMMPSDLAQIEEELQRMLQEFEELQNRKLTANNRYIDQIQDIILRNYSTDIDLNSLAEHVNLSVTYMCNLFKKETGVSIGQYIKNVRMEKAKELLLNTNIRLKDIYPRVGYSSLTYFCIVFKETYGITPTQFRQEKTK